VQAEAPQQSCKKVWRKTSHLPFYVLSKCLLAHPTEMCFLCHCSGLSRLGAQLGLKREANGSSKKLE